MNICRTRTTISGWSRPGRSGLLLGLAAGILLGVVGTFGASKPAILFCNGAGLDYLTELTNTFAVDYADSIADLNWNRITNYNVLVIGGTPETIQLQQGGSAPPPGTNEAFVAAISKFVAMGGGVFLFPMEMNIRKPMVYDFTAAWGAKLPQMTIVESNPVNRAFLDHLPGVPLAWTDQVKPSPVSSGVSQLWYPIAPAYCAAHGGPIDVDANWTVVATASATATTAPTDLTSSSAPLAAQYRWQPPSTRAPPLLAIRTVGAGRVALVNQWPQYTIWSGRKWFFDSQVLSRGAGSKPRSDWATLLTNTYAWLAAPSLANHAVGGYTTTAVRLTPPCLRPGALDSWVAATNVTWNQRLTQWQQPPQLAAPTRGLIGAQTTYGSGSSTVAEYKAAAQALGLQFVAFLDDFDKLTEAQFNRLKADCATNSDATVQLWPGYTIAANTGADHIFLFGPKLVWPPADLVTADKRFYLQQTNSLGQYTGYGAPKGGEWLQFVSGGSAGYYDFRNPQAMQVSDLRDCSLAAVRYYQHGALVEDVTPNYLVNVQSMCAMVPVALDEVRSAAELATEVQSGRGLSYHGTWYWLGHSEGPVIEKWEWPYGGVYTLAGEEFVTKLSVWPMPLAVSAANGLQEVAIYNGPELFRRFAPQGATNFTVTLFLDGVIQRNLVVVATDRRGKKAVSAASPMAKYDGGQGPTVWFCSDNVNECRDNRPRLAHGPYPLLAHVAPWVAFDPGGTWDGGGGADRPLIGTVTGTRPIVETDAGTEGAPNRFTQTPLLEFSDDSAGAVRSEMSRLFATNVLAVVNSWNTFGPLGRPAKICDVVLREIEFWSPTVPGPVCRGEPLRDGMLSFLFQSQITFQTRCVVTNLQWLAAGGGHWPTTAGSALSFAYGPNLSTVGGVLNLTAAPATTNLLLRPGSWFAVFEREAGFNTHLFIVRDQPTWMWVSGGPNAGRPSVNFTLRAVDASQGDPPLAVRQGQTRRQELFSVAFPFDVAVTNLAMVTDLLAYLDQPTGLEVLRGKRLNSPGLVECVPSNYVVEVRLPRPAVANHVTVPLRVAGLNRRWTAGLWQKEGYVRGFYGPGTNRYRALGLDAYGCAYVPLSVNLAPQTWLMAGHPVVASGAGTNLFIQVTKLWDDPPQWSVTVNNPTARPITTVLSQAMPVAGLDFPVTRLTLAAGEYRALPPTPLTLR